MHDIKWIRDNPDAFDRALARRGLAGEAQRLIGHRRAPARRDPEGGSGAGAAQRGLARRSAPPRRATRRRRAQTLMAEVARAEGRDSGAGGGGEDRQPRSSTRRSPRFPTCRSHEVPDGTDETGNVEHHHFGAQAQLRASRPSSISSWARRSARWISRPRRSCPARASWCSRAGLARLERALGQFMLDLHTTRARLHRGRRRRCWCATT